MDHQLIVVNNLTVDCLLGADFLQKHGTVLDCCSNTLPVGQDFKVVIPMNETKQFSPPPAKFYFANSSVHAPCDMEIPGRSIQPTAGQLVGIIQLCLSSQS